MTLAPYPPLLHMISHEEDLFWFLEVMVTSAERQNIRMVFSGQKPAYMGEPCRREWAVVAAHLHVSELWVT